MYNYPPAGHAPPPKKNRGWLYGCLGCGGVALLVLIVGVGCMAIVSTGDPSGSGGGTEQAAGGASAEEPAGDESGSAEESTEEPAEESPVKVTATPAEFTPSILAQGGDYTSVTVTVTNNSEENVDVNPLYFKITDTDGTKRGTAEGLGMDENQIDTVTLAPGENARGTVTAEGAFEAASVTFTDGLMGEAIKAEIE